MHSGQQYPPFLTRKQVIALVGYCDMQLHRLEDRELFPRRIKWGQGKGGRVYYRTSYVLDWIRCKCEGRPWIPPKDDAREVLQLLLAWLRTTLGGATETPVQLRLEDLRPTE
jgi:predicted DNA-binding transcriptional regulator AlpA